MLNYSLQENGKYLKVYVPCGTIKTVETLIDIEDLHFLESHPWTLLDGQYLRTAHARDNKLLHRLITNAKVGEIVDHSNRNTLDNRRCNLKIGTKSENVRNSILNFKKPKRSKNASKYIGVTSKLYLKGLRRWIARIYNNSGKRLYLGQFNTEEEAAKAYDEKAKEIFGLNANLNFPTEDEINKQKI